jgi:hypothetical protein
MITTAMIPVLWIGIVFDAIPDPNFHVDADQIRIGFKMMPISMGIITQVLHMMENLIFFYFLSQLC